MQTVCKYANLKDRFPHLCDTLCDSIQNEFLDIKKLKFTCDKYNMQCAHHPELKKASCVVYSPYMSRKDHKYDQFIFIDDEGEIVKYLNGLELQLYGMLEPILDLSVSDEYEIAKNHTVQKFA